MQVNDIPRKTLIFSPTLHTRDHDHQSLQIMIDVNCIFQVSLKLVNITPAFKKRPKIKRKIIDL